MDKMVRETIMKDVPPMKINVDELIELLNEDKAILLDIRYPFETKVWGVKFAKELPYNELPDRLNELSEDKIIVCACPVEYRASMAKEYLRYKGFNAKTLDGGLLKLMGRLKGGKAKDIKIQ